MSGLYLKQGVRLHDLSPQIVMAVLVAEGLWAEYDTDLVLTSGNDSGMKHRVRTLHAVGHAVDLRTNNLSMDDEAKKVFAMSLWTRLGGMNGVFDVVLEGLGTPDEHIHVEYQPHRACAG